MNCIQVTSVDHMLTWNLDGQQENNTLFDYNKFTKVDTYSKMDHILYTITDEHKGDFCKNNCAVSRQFTFNNAKTLINMPHHDNELACCFKPYNDYDI
jgi:hypothetical protein